MTAACHQAGRPSSSRAIAGRVPAAQMIGKCRAPACFSWGMAVVTNALMEMSEISRVHLLRRNAGVRRSALNAVDFVPITLSTLLLIYVRWDILGEAPRTDPAPRAFPCH